MLTDGKGFFDTLHDILVRATSDLDQFGFLTRPTLSTIQSSTSFDDTIIYAILHEPIYCQGYVPPVLMHKNAFLPQFQP